MLPTIDWTDDAIVMIDQRKLPVEEVYVRCRTAPEVAKAIKTMVVRGAPAIGVAAGMGLALGVRQSKSTGTQKLAAEFARDCDLMAGTRPTAVNLFWAIDRMKRAFACGQARRKVDELKARLGTRRERSTTRTCRAAAAIGGHGAAVVPRRAGILTHCNAGALATAGYGKALGVIRAAVESGKRVRVLADETRPFLQGARLTAWELIRDGIDDDRHHRQHGGSVMRDGRSNRGRRRRSHRGQWRRGEQDRHLHASPSSPRSTAFRSTWPRRSRRSTSRTPDGRASRSRSGTSARSRTSAPPADP